MKSNFFKQIIIVAVTVLLSVAMVSAQDINSNVGTSSFNFLKINVGARAVSMGGAFTGLADDASALYYNPAGITQLENSNYIAGYHNYFTDIQTGFLGYIRPNEEKGYAMGWYISYLNYGTMIKTDNSGNVLGEFGGGDLLLAMTFAKKKGYNLSYGATVKLIYEKIDEYSATGIAFDLGTRYHIERRRITLGLAIQNLGTQLSSLGEVKDKLPLTFRGGLSIQPRELPMTLSGDLILLVENLGNFNKRAYFKKIDPVIALGAEYFELTPLYLRLGWTSFGSNYKAANSEKSGAGLSFGIGFDYNDLQISYAFALGAELGDSHRITLTKGM